MIPESVAGVCDSSWLPSTSRSEPGPSAHPVLTNHRPQAWGDLGALGSIHLSSQTHRSESLLRHWGGGEARGWPPFHMQRAVLPLTPVKECSRVCFFFSILIGSLDTILDSLKKSWSELLYKQKVVATSLCCLLRVQKSDYWIIIIFVTFCLFEGSKLKTVLKDH